MRGRVWHTRRNLLLVVLCALVTTGFTVHAAAPPTASAHTTATREAATKAKLAAVRKRIAELANAVHATSAARDAINAKLAKQARQLEKAANAVHATDLAIAAQSAELDALERQRAQLDAKLSSQRAALADLLRAAYTLGLGSKLPLILGANDLARMGRTLAYAGYFQRDRATRIHALAGQVGHLDQLKTSIQTKTQALHQRHDQRTAQLAALEQARVGQRKLLAAADARLTKQQDKLAALQRDAKALSGLLKQLQQVFADIPAHLGENTPFTKLRGKLVRPVTGPLRAGTGTLAKGLVIAAQPGSAVRAVAYGRVAWADFMRGYQILVIIDHGDGWMSLYGGNEAALVSVGEWVKPGQPIATAGRDPEAGGVWFGLRHDGRPVDPRGWFAARN